MRNDVNKGIFTECGEVSIVAMIVMIMLIVIVTASHLLSITELDTSKNFRDGIAAQYLTESGVQHAIVKLKTDQIFLNNTNTNQLSAVNTLTSSQHTSSIGSYKVYVTGSGSSRTIISIGQVDKAKRQLVISVNLAESLFQYAAISGSQMVINDLVEGNVALKGNSQNLTKNGTIKGTITYNLTSLDNPIIPVSFSSAEYSNGDQSIGQTFDSGNKSLNGVYFINSNFMMNGGTFSTSTGNSTIIYSSGNIIISGTIAGDITLIANGSITFNSGTELTGNIKLFSNKDILLNRAMAGNALIMANGNITVNSNSQLNKAVVYAGNDLSINSALTGTAIAGSKLTQNSGGTITYDPAIASYFDLPANVRGLTIVAWKNHS
ncbi:hypothetical protein SPFL3102_01252 [Sporomusaceae bacterium FL31]|nr:hypothetical protein SPFL3101_00139 [Sporomusaceae bacterium FL31]GCE33445.1 hypothetical protein SPFL3102_01252 [Sporomusaceae bacterium]